MTELFQKVISCSVLAEHYNRLFGRIDSEIENASFFTAINHIGKSTETLIAPLNIYADDIDKLCEDFKVSAKLKQRFRDTLENSATNYIEFYSYKFARIPYEDWLKQLNDLGRIAAKLQSQIPKRDVNFYEMLSYFNHFEDEPDEITPKDFFNDVINKLEIIKNLRFNVVNSNLGKRYGFNSPSRKKNHALNIWIASMFNFWVEALGRNLNRDQTGIGGRKRFLEFMEACISPLHPEIVSNYAEPQGRLDTALKSLQKAKRLREQNTLQK